MPLSRSLPVVVATLALFGVAGCFGQAAEGEPEPAPVVFPDQALLSVDSTNAAKHIEVRSSPQPPAVGVTPFQFVVTDADGAPLTGLSFTVKPWMPQMNHGASVHPSVSEDGDGVYTVDNVDLIMSGLWELQTTFDDDDTADPSFDVP